MPTKILAALTALLFILTGCTQTGTADYTAPESGDANFLKGENTRSDQLYINSTSPAGGRDFRDVYIAPANLDQLRVIQPEGASADDEWQITKEEDDILQREISREFSKALAFDSAFNIVDSKDQAEIEVNTTVVAIHPNATRAEIAKGGSRGGAITVSIAVVNAKTSEVLVRSVDTKSSEDIWAFNQVENNDTAVELIFRSWGNSMRRGLLRLQGRSSDPLTQPILVKEQ